MVRRLISMVVEEMVIVKEENVVVGVVVGIGINEDVGNIVEVAERTLPHVLLIQGGLDDQGMMMRMAAPAVVGVELWDLTLLLNFVLMID